ncbi:hypothetical protein ACFL0O_10105 [Thermodesulfobacteriota bacterium]
MFNRIVHHRKGMLKTAGFGLGIMIGLFTLYGCVANTTFGNLRGNKEVTLAFHSYQVLPEYQYYTTGPNGKLYAIMGIHNDYHFQSKLWQAVNPTEEQMKAWMNRGVYGRLGMKPSGYNMIGPNGEQVGIVYSMWGNIRFSITGDNQVNVITPNFTREIGQN